MRKLHFPISRAGRGVVLAYENLQFHSGSRGRDVLLAGCGNNSSSQTQGDQRPRANLGQHAGERQEYGGQDTLTCPISNQALQLFNVQEGHYPKTLDELKPNYVAQLPMKPPSAINWITMPTKATVKRGGAVI